MRINTPVTDREVELSVDTMIVSKTDTKGRITYINRDFIDISGFTEAELMGQPHNIVRHPDMPPEAFDDLWKCLKAGRPWIGMVKNRCKNGDYYWVEAHATPLREGDQITGYMSVRRKASREQIQAAETFYAQLRAQRASAVVRNGEVVGNGIPALLAKWADVPLVSKVWLGCALSALLALAAVWRAGGGHWAPDVLLPLGAMLVVLAGLGRSVAHNLQRRLAAAVTTVERVAQGNLKDRLTVARNDEIGRLVQGVESMLIRHGFDIAEINRVVEESLRIKTGLDNVATNVMIADRDNRIIYLNKSLERTFSDATEDMRKAFGSFDVSKLIGTSIDQFHKNPAHQQQLLARLQGTHKAVVSIGSRTFTLTVNPVVDPRGVRLGTAVEWLDRTAELAIEAEVATLVEGTANGDFSHRLALEGKTGFALQLSENLNRMVETTSAGLGAIASILQSIAQGDLTRSVEGDYRGVFGQLRDDANTTVARLRDLMGTIQQATEAVNTAAKEIAAGNADLSSRTEEQASSLEETAASMEQLNSTVRNNAQTAADASALARQSDGVTQRGGEMVRQVVGTMDAIQKSASKIAEIISVIDSIAFQTNILALNAAVEAARAGEQGRGFAVVASEVRNLAHRSAQAAKEIKGLIEESEVKVRGGVQQVREAGETIEEMVANFRQLTQLVNEIANSSREQAEGIDQVASAVTQMDEVTQQNAALVEQAAAAAESLEDQAHTLTAAVATFRLSTATHHPAARGRRGF
ncbi:methyl-accepting chemotaxis protein [Niveibacterium microcysteis]|uniref:PAS domain-containing protein n=1 Tax=Niveibacterium microcysteis TaxID=2811415 RepID=A0ABX7M119_9RHOO|nr:methyl-accepting chemotaxis protein [Niveibacterium microcysteis]QSI75456.1 PAS domain-containing protein [Niveibacterium microcysteis]